MIVSNLRQRPEFASVIAERGWREWWAESGKPLQDYQAGIAEMLQGTGIPTAFVAYEGDVYAGSVLLIGNDLESRPSYTPWVAALWVEPVYRCRGIAAQLIAAARAAAQQLGYETCYLCAAAEVSPYYLKQGFSITEYDVEGLNIFVLKNQA